nr:hypothetical protein [Lachnospiraceae bacterium]
RYDSLLLVTEDKNIRDEMMSRYGADCKCSKQKELEYSGGRLSTYIDKLTTSDRVSMGRDYLKSIIMLTMCDAVICGQTSGSVAMFMLPNKWQDYYVFELGMRQ